MQFPARQLRDVRQSSVLFLPRSFSSSPSLLLSLSLSLSLSPLAAAAADSVEQATCGFPTMNSTTLRSTAAAAAAGTSTTRPGTAAMAKSIHIDSLLLRQSVKGLPDI
jgi:hypothetical protein